MRGTRRFPREQRETLPTPTHLTRCAEKRWNESSLRVQAENNSRGAAERLWSRQLGGRGLSPHAGAGCPCSSHSVLGAHWAADEGTGPAGALWWLPRVLPRLAARCRPWHWEHQSWGQVGEASTVDQDASRERWPTWYAGSVTRHSPDKWLSGHRERSVLER